MGDKPESAHRQSVSEEEITRICLDCGKCCRVGWTYPLTLSDAERISQTTGLPLEDFAIFSAISPLDENYADHPFFRLACNGRLLQLRKNGDGSCIFHESATNRCRIHNIKPIACRAFPIVFGADGRAFLDPGASDIECPLVGRDVPGVILLRQVWMKELARFGPEMSRLDEELSRCRRPSDA